MTPGLLLRLTEDALAPLIEAEGGLLHMCSTPEHAMEILGNSPKRFRVLILWAASESLPGTRGEGQDGRIEVIVQHARGLPIKPGDDIFRNRAGETPLLDRTEQICDMVRGLTFLNDQDQPHDEVDCHGYQLQNSQWLEISDSPSREYQHTYTIRWAKGPVRSDITVTTSNSTLAQLLRRQFEAMAMSGPIYSHNDIAEVYLVYLNGISQGDADVTIAGSNATFTHSPQPGDKVLLIGRGL